MDIVELLTFRASLMADELAGRAHLVDGAVDGRYSGERAFDGNGVRASSRRRGRWVLKD